MLLALSCAWAAVCVHVSQCVSKCTCVLVSIRESVCAT